MRTFVRLLLRHQALACSLLVLSLGLAAYQARTLELRFQFRDFYDYPKNDALPLFKEYTEAFGDPANYVVVMIQTQDVFRPEVLQYLQTLDKALEPEADFVRIRSLLNVNSIRGEGDEVLTGRLVAKMPATPAEYDKLRKAALSNPLLVRRLISQDGNTTALLAQLRKPVAFSTIAEQRDSVTTVTRILAAHPPPAGLRATVTGAPGIEVGTTDALIHDQLVLIPVVCVVLALLLLVTFRSLHGVLLCLASVTVAFVWTAGIYTLFGRPVDLTGSAIPITLLVYGVVDPIFVLSRFREKIASGLAKHDAISDSFVELTFPCLLTSTTTAIGFAAFVTCPAPSVSYYGLTVAIGVLLCFVTTMTVLPLLLSLVPLPKARAASGQSLQTLGTRLQRIGNVTAARPVVSAFFASALLLGCWVLARDQHLNNAYVDSLPNGQVKSHVRTLEQNLFGVARMSVYLDGPENSMKRPDVLQAIEAVEHRMEKEPAVTFASSLADLVAEANQAFAGGDPAEHRVPRSQALVGQYLTMVDAQDRADFVSDDYARTHIAMSLRDDGSEPTRALRARLEQAVRAQNFPALGVQARVTGHSPVAYGELDDVVIELMYGFVFAFAVVIVFEWITFRSWILALLTVIPNLIPIGVGFLTTRLLHIPLRIDTVLMLCISIGGLFNTTIHFVARVLQLVDSGETDEEAIVGEALRTIGPPSMFTAVVIALGFAVFLLSDFPGLQVLGLLSSITIMTGFFSDWFFTPAFVRLGFKSNLVSRLRHARMRVAATLQVD